MPPILLKAGIWIPYFSSARRIALISSSDGEKDIHCTLPWKLKVYTVFSYYAMHVDISGLNADRMHQNLLLVTQEGKTTQTTYSIIHRVTRHWMSTVPVWNMPSFQKKFVLACEFHFSIQILNLGCFSQLEQVQTDMGNTKGCLWSWTWCFIESHSWIQVNIMECWSAPKNIHFSL